MVCGREASPLPQKPLSEHRRRLGRATGITLSLLSLGPSFPEAVSTEGPGDWTEGLGVRGVPRAQPAQRFMFQKRHPILSEGRRCWVWCGKSVGPQGVTRARLGRKKSVT